MDKVVEYAEDNPDMILVLLGDKGPGESTNGTGAMYQYLACNDVGPEQLLIEDRSGSTVENITYNKVATEQHGKKDQEVLVLLRRKATSVPYAMAPDRPLEIGIFTSNFHVYQARMTAEKWGFDNVCGVSTDSDPVLFIYLCVREYAPIVKDRLMGSM